MGRRPNDPSGPGTKITIRLSPRHLAILGDLTSTAGSHREAIGRLLEREASRRETERGNPRPTATKTAPAAGSECEHSKSTVFSGGRRCDGCRAIRGLDGKWRASA